jgi:hypothetical protein
LSRPRPRGPEHSRAGSTLNVAAQVCEIVLNNGTVIVISRPFDGPTGGTVVGQHGS